MTHVDKIQTSSQSHANENSPFHYPTKPTNLNKKSPQKDIRSSDSKPSSSQAASKLQPTEPLTSDLKNKDNTQSPIHQQSTTHNIFQPQPQRDHGIWQALELPLNANKEIYTVHFRLQFEALLKVLQHLP